MCVYSYHVQYYIGLPVLSTGRGDKCPKRHVSYTSHDIAIQKGEASHLVTLSPELWKVYRISIQSRFSFYFGCNNISKKPTTIQINMMYLNNASDTWFSLSPIIGLCAYQIFLSFSFRVTPDSKYCTRWYNMSAAIQETIATCTSDDPNALNDVTNNELVLKVAGDSKVNTTISSSSDDDDDDESSITPATPKVSQEGSESVTEDDNINDNEKTTKHDDADSGASLPVNADNKRDNDQNIHSSSAENEQKTPVDWCRKCCITETCQWRQGPLGGRT